MIINLEEADVVLWSEKDGWNPHSSYANHMTCDPPCEDRVEVSQCLEDGRCNVLDCGLKQSIASCNIYHAKKRQALK